MVCPYGVTPSNIKQIADKNQQHLERNFIMFDRLHPNYTTPLQSATSWNYRAQMERDLARPEGAPRTVLPNHHHMCMHPDDSKARLIPLEYAEEHYGANNLVEPTDYYICQYAWCIANMDNHGERSEHYKTLSYEFARYTVDEEEKHSMEQKFRKCSRNMNKPSKVQSPWTWTRPKSQHQRS